MRIGEVRQTAYSSEKINSLNDYSVTMARGDYQKLPNNMQLIVHLPPFPQKNDMFFENTKGFKTNGKFLKAIT